MLKSKRFNGSMAAVVVLAVLLAVAIASGATLAWFASQDSADTTFYLGEPVVVSVADENGELADGNSLDIVIPAGQLVPGMQLYPTLYADLEASNTNALLRAEVTISATWDDMTTVLPLDWFEVDPDLTPDNGDEYYNSLSYNATDLKTIPAVWAYLQDEIQTHINSMFIQKANGWYYDDPTTGDQQTGFFYFVGNNASYSQAMVTKADTTDPNTPVVAAYTPVGTGVTTDTSDTALLVPGTIDASDTASDGAAEIASVVNGGTLAHVPFMVRPFIIPITLGNEVSEATIVITVEYQAVQDYLVDPTTVNDETVPTLMPTLANAVTVFTSAFGA